MTDDERIAKKAHELWEAEGHPHGRDQAHWDQAKEIVALEDSASMALLPRMTGAEEPVEEKRIAVDNEADVPVLTDTGDHDLTSIAREPAVTAPKMKSAARTATSRADAAKTSAAIIAPAKAKMAAKTTGKAKAKAKAKAEAK